MKPGARWRKQLWQLPSQSIASMLCLPAAFSAESCEETNIGTFFSNRSGTVAIAHGIGVNGNSDIFINLEDQSKRDSFYALSSSVSSSFAWTC